MTPEPLPPLPPVPTPLPTAAPVPGNDMIWIAACHLSLFIGVGFVLPFIVYLVKRGESELVAAHAREVLNFHICLVIYGIVFTVLSFILIGIPFLLALIGMALICPIIACIRASDGGFYRYPLTIRMI